MCLQLVNFQTGKWDRPRTKLSKELQLGLRLELIINLERKMELFLLSLYFREREY